MNNTKLAATAMVALGFIGLVLIEITGTGDLRLVSSWLENPLFLLVVFGLVLVIASFIYSRVWERFIED